MKKTKSLQPSRQKTRRVEAQLRAVARAEKPTPIPPSQHDTRILQSLRRIIRGVDLYSRKLKALFDLTTPQLVCLNAVAQHGPTTASAISRLIYLSPSTITGIVDRLESRGLVKRERQIEDRRVVRISITSSGRRLIRNAPSPLQDKLESALNRLSERERTTIAASLERVVQLMEVQEVPAAPILESAVVEETLTER